MWGIKYNVMHKSVKDPKRITSKLKKRSNKAQAKIDRKLAKNRNK